nr:MAG TPA: hypothetical protein [Crassvirales sp.]
MVTKLLILIAFEGRRVSSLPLAIWHWNRSYLV